MTDVVGRVWGWVNPANLYSSWGNKTKDLTTESHGYSRWGLASWVWRREKAPNLKTEEFWMAEEKIKPLEIEELSSIRPEVEIQREPGQSSSRWVRWLHPSSYAYWPRWSTAAGLKGQSHGGRPQATWDDIDGESDYGTPPPSPAPLSRQQLTFQFFSRSWAGQVSPEHYEICFNFLRHLFDLFVVGFLTTVSSPSKFMLDVLGVQGALKLWLHGMAMFLVASVGMAGLLWAVQEYLLHFALIYGIVQALVIAVSVRQNESEETESDEKRAGEVEEKDDNEKTVEQNVPQQTVETKKFK